MARKAQYGGKGEKCSAAHALSAGPAGVQGRTQRRLAVPQPPECRSIAKPTRLSLLHGGVPGRQPRGRERAIVASGAHRPPTSIPKNHKAAAACLAKFRVGVASFALGGMGLSNARSRLRPCTRLPVTADRADNGGICRMGRHRAELQTLNLCQELLAARFSMECAGGSGNMYSLKGLFDPSCGDS